MRTIRFLQPKLLVYGSGCASECAQNLLAQGYRKVFLVTSSQIRHLADGLIAQLTAGGAETVVFEAIAAEPTISMFEETLKAADEAAPDVVIGLGGGSVLDVSKLIAALLHSPQQIGNVFGNGLLKGRQTHLVCLPTTSGTGSEVSPNAILLDESDASKRGVVSEFLMPDGTYVDPKLTVSMPRGVTAATGMDALTHCIEAYTNKYAHPMVDLYAIEGIRLAGRFLARAVQDGADLEAREKMSLASVYGGICLGPVNTAAVHALAYPLGGEFHIPHGLSNAVLLPHVMRFNAPAAPERYAVVAEALGVKSHGDDLQRAMLAADKVYELAIQCGITMDLAKLNVPQSAIPQMAEAALKVQRLLANNPREMTIAAAEEIYRAAFCGAAQPAVP
jgi:alcohol dehydrogenase class IV